MNMDEPILHDDAIELLPWLANGSLAAGERGAVRAHAQSCVICRRELKSLEAFAKAAARSAAAFDAPAPDMRGINACIDAELARGRRGSEVAVRLRRWAADPWRFAFAVQTLIVLAVAAVWLLLPAVEVPAYRTLTIPAQSGSGHYLHVVFDPALPDDGIGERLATHGLSLEDGPSARGVYTLRFDDALDTAARHGTIDTLRADPKVLFVQPLRAEHSP
jgi:hypothetical protein